jgi:toxin ParE1/3/4
MRVRWTKPASDDFTQVCDYTNERFGQAQARRVALTIYDHIESLRTHPNKGRPGRKPGTREVTIPQFPFVVIYRVQSNVIEITRILHGAQKWP